MYTASKTIRDIYFTETCQACHDQDDKDKKCKCNDLEDTCKECGGDGISDCSSCNGEGSVECDECNGAGCDACNGAGAIDCEECDGIGTVDCEECDGTGSGIKHYTSKKDKK